MEWGQDRGTRAMGTLPRVGVFLAYRDLPTVGLLQGLIVVAIVVAIVVHPLEPWGVDRAVGHGYSGFHGVGCSTRPAS